jgi:hypothetical protein
MDVIGDEAFCTKRDVVAVVDRPQDIEDEGWTREAPAPRSRAHAKKPVISLNNWHSAQTISAPTGSWRTRRSQYVCPGNDRSGSEVSG